MKVIYVAGPYTAPTDWERKMNIYRAEQVTAALWGIGYFALSPHMTTAFFSGLCTEQVFIEGGLEFLRRSDMVVLVEGWERSGGTLGEIKEAIKLNIPIYGGVHNFVDRTEIDYKRAMFYIKKWQQCKS